jgi:hypothetical protein
MAQPNYVPLAATDRVRPANRLETPGRWEQERPAELISLRPPTGPRFGATGPDLGFGLKLARRVAERAVLGPDEHGEDVVIGCFGSGCRRSSHFHRAPTIYDMEWAFTLWGFMAGAPAELVEWRKGIFAGVSHDYSRQRVLVDLIPDNAVKLSPRDVHGRLSDWSSWFPTATGH